MVKCMLSENLYS